MLSASRPMQLHASSPLKPHRRLSVEARVEVCGGGTRRRGAPRERPKGRRGARQQPAWLHPAPALACDDGGRLPAQRRAQPLHLPPRHVPAARAVAADQHLLHVA